MPHTTDAKQIGKGPLRRGEGNGRRRESRRRTTKENRHGLRPGRKVEGGQLNDTPVEHTGNLGRQAATRVNARITVVDTQPDPTNDGHRLGGAIRSPLPLDVEHAALPSYMAEIQKEHRHRRRARSRRDNQAGLFGNITNNDLIVLALRIPEADSRRELAIGNRHHAGRGDAVLGGDAPGRRLRGVRTMGVLRARVDDHRTPLVAAPDRNIQRAGRMSRRGRS